MSLEPRTREWTSVVPGYFADPMLTIVGDRYLLYPTTDGFENWGASSFQAFSSPDLVTWTAHGVVLDLSTDVSWASTGAWAPAAAHRGDRHFLYFTAENNIGVAWSEDPAGRFQDLGRPLVPAGAYAGTAIDPAVFVDDDGAAYLYWGNTVLHGVPLGEDMMSFDPAAVRSWEPQGFREAGWVHRRGDVYYLSWSENDTRDPDYRVRYATGPTPLGPWEHRGLLLEQVPERGILAPGHHAIIAVPGTDEWIIAYHRFAIPDGNGFHREIVFDLLEHAADGALLKVVPAREPLRIPLANAQ